MKRTGPPPILVDCGVHGALSLADIAARVGCTKTAIHHRITSGVRGADLLLPMRKGRRGHPKTAAPRPPIVRHVGLPSCRGRIPPFGKPFTPGGAW